jgi:AraC-like DNA-binding protein
LNRTEKDTICVSFVEEALREAVLYGHDAAALLAQAGLPGGLLQSPLARVSADQYARLWHVLAAALDDEFFGMDTHPMRYGSFALMCHAVLDCSNLGHALERITRFLSLVLDEHRAQLMAPGPGQGTARLVMLPSAASITQPRRVFADGTYFVICHGLACWLTGRRLPLRTVHFAQASPANAAEYRLILGKHVLFGQTHSAIEWDAAALELPIVRNAASAKTFLRQAPANFLVRYRNQDGCTPRIRKLLGSRRYDEWPTFEALATLFNLTPTTLRRRLEAEGLSYQQLKDDLRKDMAITLLDSTTLPVETIAGRVGFSENSSFYRAFRKWTGLNPGAYRENRPFV